MRVFALVALSFFVAAVTVPGTAQEAQTVLRYATLAPPGSEVVRGIQAWSNELRRQTNGRVAIRVYAGGVQGDDAEMVRKLRGGRLDMAALSGAGLADVHRPILALQLPGLVQSYEQLDRARAAVSGTLEAGAQQAGFRVLGWFEIGRARIMSTTPIRTPADMRGKRVWSRTGEAMLPSFLSVVSASPVLLTVPELQGALSTGRVEVITAPSLAALALGWTSHVRYMTEMPLSIVLGATVASERAISALSEADRAIVLSTAATRHAEARRRARAAETEADRAVLTRGIQLVPTTPAQRTEWLAVGQRVRAQVASSIAPAELVARIEAAVR